MVQICGNWKGKGIEIDHVVGEDNSYTLYLNLLLEITKITDDAYKVIETYTYAKSGTLYGTAYNAGDINYQSDHLICRQGDNFISEDGSGLGVNFYKFKKNKLYFKYNINGAPSPYIPFDPSANTLSYVGSYKLKKI